MIARVHALHQEMATWYEHPSLKGRRKPLTVDHHELFTHQVARKLCTICAQVGALVGSDRDWGMRVLLQKKVLQAKTAFLGSGNQKEELRLCKNPAPEGKTRKGQKSAVFVGKGFLVSLYVCFSCFKIPEGPQQNLCCRKKKGPYWIWIQCTIMWNVNLAVGLLW